MKTNVLLLIVLPMFSWAANQAFDIKPGLWDVTSTVQMSGMPPIPNLDQMPPEQRARIEAAMKKMSANGHTNTVKSCITREGIEKAIAEANSNKGNTCKPKLASMSGSKVELHIECMQDNGEMKSNGDVTIERRDSEHFTGSGAMKTTGATGRTMDMKWSMTGAFVSSDCGNVKPSGQ
jgi:Protein of unknown function (DUF3617)